MRRTALRNGFTLTELLIVIAIIGMLAALVTVAASAAMSAAKRSAIRMQLSQLDMALEQYRQEFGEYPPDGTDPDAVRRHLMKVFPKAELPSDLNGAISALMVEYSANNAAHDSDHGHAHPATLNPSTALYFWLGGVLAKNPLSPFSLNGDRSKTFYEFELDRTCGSQYFPYSLERDGEAPFVYFKARLVGNGGHYTDASVPLSWDAEDAGIAVPYCDGSATAVPVKWRNPTKYQIITAGLDGFFGKGVANPAYPARGSVTSNEGWDDYDYDNMTNFCETTLGDELKLD